MMTRMFLAAQNMGGHLGVVKLYLSRGANIRQRSRGGMAPVHSAAMCNHCAFVDYLIKKGADFDEQGNQLPNKRACKCCGAMNVPLELSHKIQCVKVNEQRELHRERMREEVLEEARDIQAGIDRMNNMRF